MSNKILEMLRKEEEARWEFLMKVNKYQLSESHVALARARWSEVRKMRIMVEEVEKNERKN